MTAVLARLWIGTTTELPGAFVEWEDGQFTISRDNPMAIQLWYHPNDDHRLVVTKTDQLLWIPHRIDSGARTLRVHCRSYIEWLRERILPDDHLIYFWLQAETIHNTGTA